jgi:hypothetical protein
MQNIGSSTAVGIACAACEDTDGPFKETDGIYICEDCLTIADGAK